MTNAVALCVSSLAVVLATGCGSGDDTASNVKAPGAT